MTKALNRRRVLLLSAGVLGLAIPLAVQAGDPDSEGAQEADNSVESDIVTIADDVIVEGKLGVGVGTPLRRLHVHSDSWNAGAEILASGLTAGLSFTDREFGRTSETPGLSGTRWVWYSRGREAALWASNVGDLLTINPSGNVGIGASSPSYPLTLSRNGTPKTSFGRTKYVDLMVNGTNQTGGGIAISDDGGFFDWNDGYVTYEPLCCNQGLRVNSNLTVSGNLFVAGTKAFVHPHPKDPAKEIVYLALEGPEAGTYTRGTAQLARGQATIKLPEHFSAVTNEQGLTVQATCLDECNGLRVAKKSPGEIVVKELMHGESSARFDYLVQGVRAGHEGFLPTRAKKAAE